jgi:hypothetical protein
LSICFFDIQPQVSTEKNILPDIGNEFTLIVGYKTGSILSR